MFKKVKDILIFKAESENEFLLSIVRIIILLAIIVTPFNAVLIENFSPYFVTYIPAILIEVVLLIGIKLTYTSVIIKNKPQLLLYILYGLVNTLFIYKFYEEDFSVTGFMRVVLLIIGTNILFPDKVFIIVSTVINSILLSVLMFGEETAVSLSNVLSIVVVSGISAYILTYYRNRIGALLKDSKKK